LVTKKDLIVSVLCTFCLTTVLFTMMPVQSAEWDPWLDVKEDGRINVLDLIKTAGALGTMGDTTKNVTIAKLTNKLAFTVENEPAPPAGMYLSPWILVDGYSKITICIYTTATYDFYQLRAAHINGTKAFNVDDATNFGMNLLRTYDIPNQLIQVIFRNYDGESKAFSLDVYLIP